MSIDHDIGEFVKEIGAKDPSPNEANYDKWKAYFKRSNYFIFEEKIMIVKISRIEPPFWGVGKKFIDLLNDTKGDYLLVLLVSPGEGWFFTKNDVNANIDSGKWSLREADNNYKIHCPLPDRNSFSSVDHFLKKMAPHD